MFRWGGARVEAGVSFAKGAVTVSREGGEVEATYAREGRAITLARPGEGGRPRRALVAKDARGLWIACDGRTWLLVPEARDGAGRGAAESSDEIRAPMTGRVVSVAARAGTAAKEGDLLLTIEAMKMEFKLTAPEDGDVVEVACADGDRVELGQLLVRLKPATAGPAPTAPPAGNGA